MNFYGIPIPVPFSLFRKFIDSNIPSEYLMNFDYVLGWLFTNFLAIFCIIIFLLLLSKIFFMFLNRFVK